MKEKKGKQEIMASKNHKAETYPLSPEIKESFSSQIKTIIGESLIEP